MTLPLSTDVNQRTHAITLIPGDGIGPEVTAATMGILEAAGRREACTFDWHLHNAGADAFTRTGEYIPKALYASLEQDRVGLKGPVTTPIGGGFVSINVTLRKHFELFANFRPIKNLPGLNSRYPGIDLVIVRENTEDLYAGFEMMVAPGIAQSFKVITEKPPRASLSLPSAMPPGTPASASMPSTKPTS